MSTLAIETERFDSTSELAQYLESKGYHRVLPMRSLWRNDRFWAHIALFKSGPALLIHSLEESEKEKAAV